MGRCNRLETHTTIFLPAIMAPSFVLHLVEGTFALSGDHDSFLNSLHSGIGRAVLFETVKASVMGKNLSQISADFVMREIHVSALILKLAHGHEEFMNG